MANEEKFLAPNSPERSSQEVIEAAGRQLENLGKKGERSSAETAKERRDAVDRARKQVELEAVSSERNGDERPQGGEPEAPRQTPIIGKRQKNQEYKKTMVAVQSNLSTTSRAFSKTIHQPGVEKVSETLGASVARPNAILAGSFTAFLAVLGVYLLARYNGFRLSGFETIAAFVVGWAIGTLLDLLRVALSHRRNKVF